ncbi:MAG: NADPH-dependent FMN reductase [Candidatus Wenzhouxiangella sp. M2_3B_020]
MSAPRILAFAGSTRKNSFNRRLLAIAVDMSRDAGLEVDHVELADYPMPIFDEDLEAEHGQDPNATRLRRKLADADGLLLACPEYNSSITPLMKNVIDWVSRTEEGGSGVGVYEGKKALLIGASPGPLGGSRSMATVHSILDNIKVGVMDTQFSLSKAGEAFTGDDELSDEEKRMQLSNTIDAFAAFLRGEAPANPS